VKLPVISPPSSFPRTLDFEAEASSLAFRFLPSVGAWCLPLPVWKDSERSQRVKQQGTDDLFRPSSSFRTSPSVGTWCMTKPVDYHWEIPLPFATFTFVVHGLKFVALMMAAGLKEAFLLAAKEAVAEEAGSGILPEHVSMDHHAPSGHRRCRQDGREVAHLDHIGGQLVKQDQEYPWHPRCFRSEG